MSKSLQDLVNYFSFHHYIAFLPILIATLVFIRYTYQLIQGKANIKWYWLSVILFVLFVRSNDFYLNFINPDEEQWLICANSMLIAPLSYLDGFYLFDATRILTILPLSIFGFFTSFLDYEHARILNLSLFLFYFYIQFMLIKILFDLKTSVFVTSFAVLFFSVSKMPDLVAYNSEIPALFLLTLALYLFKSAIYSGVSKNHNAYLIGLVIGLVPFAKEQALFITVLTFLFFASYWFIQKDYSKILFASLGGTTALFIFIFPLLRNNGITDFIWIIQNAAEYAKYGLKMDKSAVSGKGIKLLKSVWLNKELFLLFSLAIISFGLQVFSYAIGKSKIALTNLYFLLLFLVTLYTIYLPGNFFFHYTIFLLLPLSFLLAWLYFNYSGKIQTSLLIPLVLLTLFVSKVYDRNWRLFYPVLEIFTPDLVDTSDPVYKLITEYSKPGDRMLIWGWANHYYLSTKMQRASGFLYPQFAMGVYSGKKRANEFYLNNVKKFRPEVIVELAGKGRFFFDNKWEHSIQNNAPDLYKEILGKYDKLKEDSNFVFYKRK